MNISCIFVCPEGKKILENLIITGRLQTTVQKFKMRMSEGCY